MSGTTPILFLHIPKTAGTTVHHILNNEYRGLPSFSISHPDQISIFEKLSKEERWKIKVLKGHFVFGADAYYSEPTTYFTFLREPIKRSISSFNYLKSNHVFPFEKSEEQYSLKDLLKSGHKKNFDNCHVRFLAGTTHLAYGEVNEETYQLALSNFENYFDSFGICERFDESLIYLKQRLNWAMPYYVKANVSEKKSYLSIFDEETYQLLNYYNRFDLLLYEHANKKFDAIIRLKGESFEKEVRRFKKLNSLQAPFRKLARTVWQLFQPSIRN